MSALYLDHFGLNKPPFQITPDIDFFFSGSHRGDLLSALLHVADHEEGIVTVIAEVGSGKTLLARLMLSRLPEDVSTVYLANPCFSRDEILSAIARDLGLSELPAQTEGKLAALHQELLRRHGLGQRVLLVLDEAHTMPVESLEEVRLLSNLETACHKLVNIMLFGQPELDELLADRHLRQVRDRVIHRFELPPLPHDEGAAYIDHRLRTAGWHGGKLFNAAALNLLLKSSGGRARRINLLADKCLLAAYAEGKRQIEARHVRSALRELQEDPAAPTRIGFPWWTVLPVSLALAVLMTAIALWILSPSASKAPALMASAPSPAATAAKPPQHNDVGTAPSQAAPPAQPAANAAPAQALPSPEKQPPGDKAKAAFLRTAEKLAQPKPQGYTVQLATLPGASGLPGYIALIEQHIDAPQIFAHNWAHRGKDHVAVFLGNYANANEARAALNQLPKPLKTNQPILRTWAGISKELKL
ncbi:MAG: hypothetical protein BWY57_00346 [Betaproteobacteria bacterium ADurb.Bin341]|nr:MAG: hypothetical protein BWY57_00346 [Betaproteobacteria bacterium ADurb.Bin341]